MPNCSRGRPSPGMHGFHGLLHLMLKAKGVHERFLGIIRTRPTVLPHLVVSRAKEKKVGFGGNGDASIAKTTFEVLLADLLKCLLAKERRTDYCTVRNLSKGRRCAVLLEHAWKDIWLLKQ